MIITLYYARIWREGVRSGKRIGTNNTIAQPFRTREACQEFIYKRLPRYTQKDYIEPTWVNWSIVTKKQYIPPCKKTE